MDALHGRCTRAAAPRLDARQTTPLRLRGAGTKDFYGERCEGTLLDLRAYRGVVDYEPSELVITARCGTPLSEIEACWRASRQFLAFEPPAFGADPTIGGVIAAGLSGPRRNQAGAARDFVLGAVLLCADGRAAALWRQGHEERRRLRCRPPAVRLARHPRRHHRGVAQGAAAAARGADAAIRDDRPCRAGQLQPLGGRAAADLGDAPGATGRRGCAVGRVRGAARGAASASAANCSAPRRPSAGWRGLRHQYARLSSATPARCGECRCLAPRRRLRAPARS